MRVRGIFSSDPKAQERCYTQSIQPCRDVVEDDAPAFGEAFEAPNREGFCDVEEAKKNEGDKAVSPVGGAEEKSDPLAGYFIDDHEPGVVTAALTGSDGGSGDA